jgi:hypothetical protein
MNDQKEIESFVEADKSTVELVEMLMSCAFEEGEQYGKYKGKSVGWTEAFGLIQKHTKEPSELYIEGAEKFLESVQKSDYKNAEKEVKPLLKDTEILKKALWNVLKRRLKKGK